MRRPNVDKLTLLLHKLLSPTAGHDVSQISSTTGQSGCHFGASIYQSCRDVQPSLTLATGAMSVPRWRDLIVQFSRRLEDTRGRARCPPDYWSRAHGVGPYALVHLQPCGAAGLSPACLHTSTCPYFYASLASAFSACHLMLLYSTSSYKQTLALHLQRINLFLSQPRH